MSSEPIPALTPIGPFDPGYKPVQEVTPFTYNDGFTYLQKLEVLAYYVNQRLVGSVNDIILAEAGFQTNVNSTISAFTDAQNAAMHELAASLIQWQVLDNADGTINYMMEDGSHITVYTVAGIKGVMDAQDAKLAQFQVTLNGAVKDQNDAITAANTAQSAVIASNNAAQNVQIAKRQWTYAVDFVSDCGADPTGVSSSDDAWDKAIGFCRQYNGIILNVPVGRFRATRQWNNIPSSGYSNPPLVIRGSGMLHFNTAGGDEYTLSPTEVKGSIFFSEYNSGGGQYRFDAIGEVNVSDIAFLNQTGANITQNMVTVTRSSLMMERCSFTGFSGQYGQSCNQDGIYIGEDGNQFIGYGSSFKDLAFDRIKVQMNFGRAANSIHVSNVVGAQTCGSGDGTPAVMMSSQSDQVTGNTIVNYFIEGMHYTHMFGLYHAYNNTFVNPGAWDCWGDNQMLYMFDIDPASNHWNTVVGVNCDSSITDDKIWKQNSQASPHDSNSYYGQNNIVVSGIKSNYGGPLAIVGGAFVTSGGFYLPILPDGSTVQYQRGSLIYNDTTRKLNFWDGSTWHEVTSG